jgi:glycerol kinase
MESFSRQWELQHQFQPQLGKSAASRLYGQWQKAVQSTLSMTHK